MVFHIYTKVKSTSIPSQTFELQSADATHGSLSSCHVTEKCQSFILNICEHGQEVFQNYATRLYLRIILEEEEVGGYVNTTLNLRTRTIFVAAFAICNFDSTSRSFRNPIYKPQRLTVNVMPRYYKTRVFHLLVQVNKFHIKQVIKVISEGVQLVFGKNAICVMRTRMRGVHYSNSKLNYCKIPLMRIILLVNRAFGDILKSYSNSHNKR